MSNKLVSPLYYVYKLTFSTGETYVGCHVQKKSNDRYITSSSFYKNHKDVPFTREIRLTEDMPIPEGFHPGRTLPKACSEKQKDLIWYTNGQKNIRLHKDEIPQEGFYKGSTQIRKANRQTP